MRLRISIRGRVRPLVRPSVHPSVGPSDPCYFRKTKIVDFVGRKSSNDIINNATMSDDEVVAFYGSPRSLFKVSRKVHNHHVYPCPNHYFPQFLIHAKTRINGHVGGQMDGRTDGQIVLSTEM